MLSENHGCASPSNTKPLIFRINENGVGPEVVRDVLLDRGWEEFVEGEMEEFDWNLWWRTSRFRLCDYTDLMPWQRLNHFPKTIAITKKDTLARNMRRMKGVYGSAVFNFTPNGFNLPNDYTKFVAEYSKRQQTDKESGKKTLWICKPADMSRGRGIFIFKDLSDLTYDCSAVAQRYITNPLLIGGYKFDLRIYVLVTSFNPLHIYMYQEGIVRFSTEKFDLSSLGNMFCHLTNTSINKLGPSYTAHKEGVGPGCKWSLTMLRNYFNQQGINDEVIWQRICNIVTLTMLAQAPTVPKSPGCVELFGYDILIDDNLKPWLLEVNFSPALGLDCTVDHNVKRPLINDILDLMHFEEGDENRGGEKFVKLKQKQVYNSNRHSFLMPSKRGVIPKSAVRDKPILGPVGKVNKAGSKSSLSKVSSRSRVTSGAKLAPITKGSVQKVPSNSAGKKHLAEDAEEDYDDEIRAACKRTPSEVSLQDSKSSQDEQLCNEPNSSQSNKSGNGIQNILPSLEDARKQLDSRRELIRSQQRKRTPLSSPRRRPSSNSLGNPSSIELDGGRVEALSSMSLSKSQSQLHPPSRGSCSTEPTQSNQYAKTSRKGGVLPSGNSQGSSLDHAQLKKKSALTKPLTSRTGLKMGARDGPPSIMRTEQGVQGSKAKSSMTPPQRVGDFVLTFPFNEATRRASAPSLDIRTIIKETQKTLRRTICKAQSSKQLTRGLLREKQVSGGSVKQEREVTVQWTPLISQPVMSGEG
ncbi:probable tubulin polyglutamylase TTLL2 [Lytechinus variegatus]|uniref:probable tubulin polyglutamylase TTLL2 n=1 Tax=Lytechinus variegatus TaxID=7654 RepID=UPI001BB17E0F|nr:probable tubulin polyglutamylase TTLL2 [Lytechinus variegatus]